MKLIRARARGHRHDAAGRVPKLGRIVVCDDLELLHRINRQARQLLRARQSHCVRRIAAVEHKGLVACATAGDRKLPNMGRGPPRARRRATAARPTASSTSMAEFFHDVPADVTAEAMARGERDQSGTPFEKPWPLAAWPDVPTRFLLCRDDRFFPADFMRRVVHERLGITPDEIDGGHLPALAPPDRSSPPGSRPTAPRSEQSSL